MLLISNVSSQREKMIYHYCSEEVFHKITQTKIIWLSDISKMNDNDEYKSGYQILKEMLKSYNLSDDDLVFEMSEENLNKSFHILIACFSKKGDLKSQWNEYADNGKGFSIGFDEELLMQNNLFNRFIENNIEPISSKVQFIPVNYNLEKFKEQAEKIIKQHLKSESPIKMTLLARALMFLSISYKDIFFREENEIRAVITPEHKLDEKYEINIRKTEHGDAYYHELKTSYENFNSIKKIVLGPKNDYTPQDIKSKLSEYGLNDVNIEVSNGRGKYR